MVGLVGWIGWVLELVWERVGYRVRVWRGEIPDSTKPFSESGKLFSKSGGPFSESAPGSLIRPYHSLIFFP